MSCQRPRDRDRSTSEAKARAKVEETEDVWSVCVCMVVWLEVSTSWRSQWGCGRLGVGCWSDTWQSSASWSLGHWEPSLAT